MPNKTITFMLSEQSTIIKRITDPLKFTDLTQERKEGDLEKRKASFAYANAIKPFVGAKEFANASPENQNALFAFTNRVSEVWGEMLHKVEALYLYKGACIEHRKMAASDKVPESYKKISKNCILEIEKTLKENGFTKDMLKQALEEDHFENMFLPDYAKKLEEMYISFSIDNKLALNDKITPKTLADAMLHHTSKTQKGVVRMATDLDTLIADPIAPKVAFAKSGLPYFETDLEHNTLAKTPRDYNEDYSYKFFVMKDGKYVDKPAPSGFFSKIAFYFKKYVWDADDLDREKKLINTEMKKEQEELAKVPEDIDGQLVADLTPVDDVKEQTAAPEERAEDIAKENEQFTEGLGLLTKDEMPAQTEEMKPDPKSAEATMALGQIE